MATEAIELMLADLRWTRRLAVTLARDSAEADDLWSETWAAARREQKPVQRGWIATTMRNVVRMSRRAEKRRLAREIASAELAAAAHTPEELLARVELQKTLAELVTGIGEPYRTTLLLHHVEDLAPVEIARRLAIPAGTVRWRLKVAHDELRDRLIDRSGGDRDAWRLALVPLLPGGFQWPPDAGAQRPGQTAPAKGGTTMVTWKLLALFGATMAVSGTVLHAGHDATTTAGTSARPKAASATTTATPAALPNGALAANTPAGTAGKGSSAGKAAKSVPPADGKCDDCVHRRAFAVPSAAIADFEAPDLDACFAAVPRSPTYKRIDLSLALKREGATAAIKGVAPKFVSDELAHTPGLVDCLKRTLAERDMPAPGASGPAELAIFVSDGAHVNVEPGPAPGGAVTPDGQAPSLGERNARLTITVFTDFQCPFCWRFAARLQSLAELYPGQLRIELRNDPLPFHTQAELGAEAALAAHEQGKFWAMHDELFANQNSIDREHLRAIAQKIGLDVPRFEQALDDGHVRARVQRDIDTAKRLGIRGVPATVIGDQIVPGALPLEEMVRHIDRALAARTR